MEQGVAPGTITVSTISLESMPWIQDRTTPSILAQSGYPRAGRSWRTWALRENFPMVSKNCLRQQGWLVEATLRQRCPPLLLPSCPVVPWQLRHASPSMFSTPRWWWCPCPSAFPTAQLGWRPSRSVFLTPRSPWRPSPCWSAPALQWASIRFCLVEFWSCLYSCLVVF